MDAFFVIPAMVSPNVNERLVPALAKTIERNTVLNYYGAIRTALMRKFSSPLRGMQSENTEIFDYTDLYESEEIELNEGQKTSGKKHQIGIDLPGIGSFKAGTEIPNTPYASKEADILSQKKTLGDKEGIELPAGITFYNTIGLEPTYLQIPMQMKQHSLMGGSGDRLLMVGFKCVPYELTGVNDVIALLKDLRGRSEIGKWFLKKWRTVATKIPLTVPRSIRKKGVRGGSLSKIWTKGSKKYDVTKDIIYSPPSEVLSDPSKLSKLMTVRGKSNWSTLVVLSNVDFDEGEMQETLRTYRDLSKSGMGDLVVVNEASENAYYCTTKMGACNLIPFAYMRNIMNLDNVLDYAEVSRWSKPFNIAPLRKALNDGYIEYETSSPEKVVLEINEMLNEESEPISFDDNDIQSDIGGPDTDQDGPLDGDDADSVTMKVSSLLANVKRSQVVRDLAGVYNHDEYTDPFDNTPKVASPTEKMVCDRKIRGII